MAPAPKVVRLQKPKKAESRPDWLDYLILNERDRSPKGCLSNAIDALRFAPEWQGVIAFNEFSSVAMCMERPPLIGIHEAWDQEWKPRPWSDTLDILTAEWLQKQGIMVSDGETAKAVQAVAEARRYHPVREYLEGVQWDGVRRLPTWTSRYLGVEPTLFTEGVGIRWMISAVARIFDPGCKADCALVLKGKQGIKKSTALSILGGDWFTDQLSPMGTKDSSGDLQGAWIIELAELDALARTDMSSIKLYLASNKDRFRPSYGRRTQEFPRQCVFAGTVNPEGGIFKDPTGARRFWPLDCTMIDTEGLSRDRDQLWAEAVYLYQDGATWWLDSSELNEAAQAVQDDDYIGDLWDEKISNYIFHKNEVTVADILENALGIATSYQGKKEQMRVGGIMTSMGWSRVRMSQNGSGKRPWGYKRS